MFKPVLTQSTLHYVQEIANHCHSFAKDTLAPIPLAESKAILESINAAVLTNTPDHIVTSSNALLILVSTLLHKQGYVLRWSVDPSVIWDIDPV